MTERKDQPSKVSTEEEVRPSDEHVVTSDLPENVIAASDDDQTAKPAASDDKTDQKPAASAAADDNQAKPQGRDRPAERRIKRLTKQVADLEAHGSPAQQKRIESLERQIDELRQGQAKADPEPEFKDFESPQEYAKAYSDWETRQAGGASKPAKPDTHRKPGVERSPDAHAQHDRIPSEPDPEVVNFQKRGTEKLGDEFAEALALPGTAVDADMGEFLIDSDFGPEIYVHLANNQDEAKKIFDSGARRKIKALEDLEAKAKKGELDIDSHDAPATTDQDDKPAKDDKPAASNGTQQPGHQTKAADPPSDTRDAGGGSAVKKDPNDESMDEYAARRNREMQEQAGIYR